MTPPAIHASAAPRPEQVLHEGARGAPFSAQSERLPLGLAAGAALVVHGLGHAVLPFRGAGRVEATALLRTIGDIGWLLALVGFVAAGIGVLGARPWRGVWTHVALASTVASVVAILAFESPDLWPGLIGDAIVAWAVGSPARSPLLQPAPRSHMKHAAWLARDVVLGALLVYVAVAAVLRPWILRWGTTAAEVAESMPGDPPDRDARFELDNAVTIAAPPSAVRRRIENARPEWRAIGLDPAPNGATRLVVREKSGDPHATAWSAAVSLVTFEVPHFFAQRATLLRIKEQAERSPPSP
jgi:hypothetical protein